MKLIIFTSILFISCQLNCQELYIQSFDKLKGSDRVLGNLTLLSMIMILMFIDTLMIMVMRSF